MKRLLHRSSILLAVALTVLVALPASANTIDPHELKAQALASLNDGYHVLVTGDTTRSLTPDRGEVGIARTAEKRLADMLFRRDFNAVHGARFTEIRVKLNVLDIKSTASSVLLRADEEVEMRFVSAGRSPDPERDVTLMRIPHTFVFKQVGRAWRLDFDDAGGMRNSGPAADTLTDITPARLRKPGASARGGHVAAMDPQHAEGRDSRPDPSSRGVSAYGTYDRAAAARYAYDWACWQCRNPAYRNFSPDDCTNFVSQALRAGGWQNTGGFKWDWNNWWYNDSGQAEAWTFVAAMRQFMSTSGRGFALNYINDLYEGDVLQADFGQDGSWNHGLMVDARYSSNLADIFVSYHDTDTRHRMMSDFLAAVQTQYGNTTYNAWMVLYTSN